MLMLLLLSCGEKGILEIHVLLGLGYDNQLLLKIEGGAVFF